jgi:hypothetical protein
VFGRTLNNLYSAIGVYNKIGIEPEGLIGFYSADLTKEGIKLVDELLNVIGLSTLNTRIGKIKEINILC